MKRSTNAISLTIERKAASNANNANDKKERRETNNDKHHARRKHETTHEKAKRCNNNNKKTQKTQRRQKQSRYMTETRRKTNDGTGNGVRDQEEIQSESRGRGNLDGIQRGIQSASTCNLEGTQSESREI